MVTRSGSPPLSDCAYDASPLFCPPWSRDLDWSEGVRLAGASPDAAWKGPGQQQSLLLTSNGTTVILPITSDVRTARAGGRRRWVRSTRAQPLECWTSQLVPPTGPDHDKPSATSAPAWPDSMTTRRASLRCFSLYVGIALAIAVFTGLAVSLSIAPAGANGILNVIPATGLVQRQVVTVTSTGLANHAYGNVLECNDSPGEPTVPVGRPFDLSLPVGCSPPSLKQIVSTSAAGVLLTRFKIRGGDKVGPPCGLSHVFGPCAHSDSSGNHPRSDAHNYPCPPTSAERAIGATCSLVFYDTAGQVVSTPISFRVG